MAQRKNYMAIGLFILGALGLLFFLLIFFSGGNRFTDKERVVMYFEGSVQGLQIGAPIKLKGVDLGEIVKIEVTFLADDVTVINVVTADLILKRINHTGTEPTGDIFDELVEKGLRAQLNYQSLLTGLLYVELEFYPGTDIRLLNLQSQYREFPTIQPDLESLFKEIKDVDLRSISTNLKTVLESIDELFKSGKIDKALTDFSTAAQSIDKTANDLSSSAKSLKQRMTKLTNKLNASLEKFDELIDKTSQEVPTLSNEISLTLSDLRLTLNSMDETMKTASETFSEDAIFIDQITRSATELARATRAIRELSETLEQQPEAILRGKKRK